MSNISNRSACHCPSRIEQRRRVAALCHLDDPLREQLAARSLETIHFGPEYCGRALSRREGGEWGDGNECTGDEALCRRERSETADGRCGPGRGKGSGSCREDNLQGRDRHNRDGIYDFIALERVLIISTPMRRIPSGCCALAASGHAAAAPPSRAMNVRRSWGFPTSRDSGCEAI